MVKGNLGKMMWMETLKNESSRDVNMFDLASIDGDAPSEIQDQMNLELFSEAVESSAA